MLFRKIRIWWALRKARKLEQIKIPNRELLVNEQNQFIKETQELKHLITKKVRPAPIVPVTTKPAKKKPVKKVVKKIKKKTAKKRQIKRKAKKKK